MQISLALKWKRKSPLLAFGDCHLSRASFQFEMWCFGEGRPPSRWRQCSERLHEAHSAADVSPVLVRRGQVRGNCHECLPQRVAVVTGRPGVVRDRLEGELQTILLK